MRKMVSRILVAILLILVLAACSGGAEQEPTPMPELAFDSLVSVTGEVLPARWAELSIQTGGTVRDMLVEPGDDVREGDLLVKLDTTDAELAVHEAEAQLASAKAQLEQLKAQPRPKDVAAAEEQVDEAEIGISQAIAERDRLASGVIASDIADAQAALESAEAGRKTARIDYDEVQKKLENDDVDEWEGEKAALELRAARESEEAARLSLVYVRGNAEARLEEAAAGVRGAEAQRDLALAQLDRARTGASDEAIALAETDVARAQVALDEAQLRLERCERRAPFSGTVGMVRVREGEQIQQGDPVVTLGDLSTLRVETTDLDEIDVARIDIGQSVDVTFDTFPDKVFKGRVTRIAPMAEAGGGGVNYTTIIELEDLAPEIRWGMTAFVDIDVGR